jgi:dihydroneopterin aldolase
VTPPTDGATLALEGTRIVLRGLRVLGHHGAGSVERAEAQPFEVDLDLELAEPGAAWSDELAETLDYGTAAQAVAAVVSGTSHRLLESLARACAEAVLAEDRAGRLAAVGVRVTKLRPPVPLQLESAACELTLRRA